MSKTKLEKRETGFFFASFAFYTNKFSSAWIYKVTQTKLCQSKQIFAFHPFDSKLHPAYSATHLNYIVL